MSGIKRILNNMRQASSLFWKGTFLSVRTLCAGDRDKFRNKSDKDVLFCGNGPSLSHVDLKKARNRGMEIACVNFFPANNKVFFEVRPQYLFLMDQDFFKYTDNHPGSNEGSLRFGKLYDNLKKVDWNLEIIVPQGSRLPIHNECIKVTPISKYTCYGDGATRFLDMLYRHDLVLLGAQNVAIAAVFFLLHRTTGTIYLTGVDMTEYKNLIVDENNDAFMVNIHNYGTIKRSTDHVIKKGEFYKLLGYYQRMFEQFYYLSRYAKRLNRTIINLTLESHIDVFDKKIIRELEADGADD